MNTKIKLAYMVSHPIQYQAPLLRRLSREPDIDLTVFFCSDHGAREYADQGFGGVRVKWDVPLLEGYKYEVLPALRSSSEPSFASPINRGIYRALKKGDFDALWLHGYWSIDSLVAMLAAKALGIPVLQRTDGTLIDRPRSALKHAGKRVFFFFLRLLVDGVLPVGSLNRDYWAHYLGPNFPSFLVPYAVDNAYFQSRSASASGTREKFRRELNLEPGRAVILYASKLMERKRCIDLVEACLGMHTEKDGRRPYLLIVGDGSERAACEVRVRSAGAGAESVRFLGFQNQSELSRFFDLCDLFVLPSVHEPFALVVNEVMNAGRAIVVSDEVGCQPDLVIEHLNGRVFPAGDVAALRKVLEDLMANPDSLREMGVRSLERINQWSFEEDIRGIREALHHVADLPLTSPAAAEEFSSVQPVGAELRSQIA